MNELERRLTRFVTACPDCGFSAHKTIRQILREVGEAHGISMETMLGRNRRPVPVHARDCAAARLHKELHLGPDDLAAIFGRDHSTMITSLKRTNSHHSNRLSTQEKARINTCEQVGAETSRKAISAATWPA